MKHEIRKAKFLGIRSLFYLLIIGDERDRSFIQLTNTFENTNEVPRYYVSYLSLRMSSFLSFLLFVLGLRTKEMEDLTGIVVNSSDVVHT